MEFMLIDGLIDVLANELEIYKEVLKISKDKTKVIIGGNVTELEETNRLEQSKIFLISDLEDIREKITGRLAIQLDKNLSEVNISFIKSLLPEDRAQKLDDTQTNMLKVLNEIKEVNSLNAKLIKNSLEYIDFSVNLLTGAEVSGNLYSNSGQTGDTRQRKFFDVKL